MINEYIFQIGHHSSIKPETILEIGALDGRYSKKLQTHFNLTEASVYLVEPNPTLNEKLTQHFPEATIIKAAVSDNISDNAVFNLVNSEDYNELGCSSLMTRMPNAWNNHISKLHSQITVATITGASLLCSINKPIDLCIIDVEGQTYNVLKSFENHLTELKSIMIECEHIELFRNQRLFNDIQGLLIENQFRLMSFKYSYKNQSDSIWIHENYVDFDF